MARQVQVEEGPAIIYAAIIGGVFLLAVAVAGWIIAARNNAVATRDMERIKHIEIQSVEGAQLRDETLQLRGLLEEQAAAVTDLRSELSECQAQHVRDERNIFVCDQKIAQLQEILTQKDFEIRALRFDIQQLQARLP